jgi:hypothetical protein
MEYRIGINFGSRNVSAFLHKKGTYNKTVPGSGMCQVGTMNRMGQGVRRSFYKQIKLGVTYRNTPLINDKSGVFMGALAGEFFPRWIILIEGDEWNREFMGFFSSMGFYFRSGQEHASNSCFFFWYTCTSCSKCFSSYETRTKQDLKRLTLNLSREQHIYNKQTACRINHIFAFGAIYVRPSKQFPSAFCAFATDVTFQLNKFTVNWTRKTTKLPHKIIKRGEVCVFSHNKTRMKIGSSESGT